MPYRRSGTAYRRRRSRAKHMWIRNFETIGNQLSNDTIWAVDLLGSLRTHTDVQGRAIEGSYTAANVPEGATVTRILGRYTVFWQTLGLEELPAIDDEMFFGCTIQPWLWSETGQEITVPTTPEVSPFDPAAMANTADWMAWGFRHWSENVTPFTGGLTIGGVAITNAVFQTHQIDIRSKRKLREIGQGPVFCSRFGGASGAGPKEQRLTTSVLLSYY